MKESQSLCHGQINFHVHEIRTSLCERDERWEKKGKKCADYVREKRKIKFGERISE
jgi:hypothetical protein